MNPIDEMKTQADMVARGHRAMIVMEDAVAKALCLHCPDSNKAAWVVQTLANLVQRTLYSFAQEDLGRARFYVESVKRHLDREMLVEDD